MTDLEPPPLIAESESILIDESPMAPSSEEGTFRSGKLAARVESVILHHRLHPSAGPRASLLYASMTVTFANAGPEPIALILVKPYEAFSMMLENGLTLGVTSTSARRGESQLGLGLCERDVTICRTTDADSYTQVEPGASLTFNFVLSLRLKTDDPAYPTLPSVETGNLGMRLHVIEGTVDRVVHATFLRVPLRNVVRL